MIGIETITTSKVCLWISFLSILRAIPEATMTEIPANMPYCKALSFKKTNRRKETTKTASPRIAIIFVILLIFLVFGDISTALAEVTLIFWVEISFPQYGHFLVLLESCETSPPHSEQIFLEILPITMGACRAVTKLSFF
jgi:uncharacterized integral membrane protein